ncbi:unnamed protein product [Diatraea saccharalis]|uniref:UDP-glucuronosyltransferase n=1 Tax=Diatraea saccharalis TaxID=40085 RepID=A0A9N9R8H7_9NEOP|nr:unnamed protein product [Diatraea saccharalis]
MLSISRETILTPGILSWTCLQQVSAGVSLHHVLSHTPSTTQLVLMMSEADRQLSSSYYFVDSVSEFLFINSLHIYLYTNTMVSILFYVIPLITDHRYTDQRYSASDDFISRLQTALTFCLSALIFSHVLKVPAIQISSLGTVPDVANIVGAPSHPLLYPYPIYQKIYNLTIWDKLQQLYIYYQFQKIAQDFETGSDTIVQKLIGAKIPKLSELKKNVELVFLNVHSIWEMNRPMPPNVIYLGGLHQQPERKLPKDFQSYLDSSKHGVIYASFGTNIDPTLLPPHKIQILINVFSKLPYDILWKWNKDELHGLSDNIKISKWLPQADLLKHPKIKVFITQGGLQSTDEAIAGGVPLIGIPMVSDQWYNVEQYVHHGIGVRVDMETIDEEKFRNAINEILNNDSYRRNILRIKRIIDDQPQTSLERGVWWTEYVIRHGGAKHLRSPAANMSWTEYLELELFLYLWTTLMILIVGLIFMVYTLIGRKKMNGKLKSN